MLIYTRNIWVTSGITLAVRSLAKQNYMTIPTSSALQFSSIHLCCFVDRLHCIELYIGIFYVMDIHIQAFTIDGICYWFCCTCYILHSNVMQ